MSLSVLHIVVAALMTFLGSTVLGSVGFGMGMTATPVMLLVLDPQTVVIVVNTVSLAVFGLIIFQDRAQLPVREMMPVSIAGLLGVPVGVLFLDAASASFLRVSITVVIIFLAISVAFKVRGPLPRSDLVGPPVGFIVGVLLTSLAIGGPLMALFLLTRDWSRDAVRTSLALYFLAVEGSGVVGYAVAGMFTLERIVLVLAVTVPVLMGFGLATVLVRRMNERIFRNAVVVVIIGTSVMVLAREVLRLGV